METYFTVKQVAEMLQLGQSKAYDLFRAKDFPYTVVGQSKRVSESNLESYLKKHTNPMIH